MQEHYRDKWSEVDKLHSEINSNNAIYAQHTQKNNKIARKIELIECEQGDESMQMELQISDRRGTYESLKKTYAELVDQINAELGHFESVEEFISQGDAYLENLHSECNALDNALNDEIKLKTANEEKLSMLQRMDMQLELETNQAEMVRSLHENRSQFYLH